MRGPSLHREVTGMVSLLRKLEKQRKEAAHLVRQAHAIKDLAKVVSRGLGAVRERGSSACIR
jgi:hypothetical protein